MPALLIALCLIALSASAGQLYRYVDKDGKVVYSDQPPPKSAKKIEKKNLGEVKPDASLPYNTRETMKRFPVTLYANECGDPCNQGKALLEKRGVPYSQRNPESSKEDAEALKKLVGGLDVPVLVVGKLKHVKGFEEGAWNSTLDAAGYSRSNPGVNPAALNKSAKASKEKAQVAGGANEETKPAPKDQ